MITGQQPGSTRYDGTLRVVMWLDAFWSAAATLIAIGGTVAVALLGLPDGAHRVVGISALVAAAFLAACGAVTGVLLMLRMNAGHYTMPADLRVPLPRAMVPRIGPDATPHETAHGGRFAREARASAGTPRSA